MHMMVSDQGGKHSRWLQEDCTDGRKGGDGPEQRKKQDDMNFSRWVLCNHFPRNFIEVLVSQIKLHDTFIVHSLQLA